jgi:alpha/beta superfamily hydrolase
MVKTEDTWIKCGDATLYGEIYIPDVVPAPAVLVCHGMDTQGFHFLKIYTQLAEAACRNGFVSLVFDFRGVGKSTGKFDYGFAEQQDVKCALNYLASRQEALPDKTFIVGHSLGGAVSLYAVQNERRVNGLVLWSTPKNHTYNVKKFIRRTRGKLGLYLFLFFAWIDKLFDVSSLFKLEVYGINLRPKYVREKLMKLNECEAVSKLKNIPLLILVGDEDVIVDVTEARQVFLSAPEPKDFLIIRGADHIYNGKEDEIIAQTIKWLKKWE